MEVELDVRNAPGTSKNDAEWSEGEDAIQVTELFYFSVLKNNLDFYAEWRRAVAVPRSRER